MYLEALELSLDFSTCLPLALICCPLFPSIPFCLAILGGPLAEVSVWFWFWLDLSLASLILILFCPWASFDHFIYSADQSPVLFSPWAQPMSSAYCLSSCTIFSSLSPLHHLAAISYGIILINNWGHLVTCPQRIEKQVFNKNLYRNVYSSITHNSKKVETT